MKGPTTRQLDVLRALATLRSPTLRKLGATLGLRSTNAIAQHLDLLKKKGLVINLEGRWHLTLTGWIAVGRVTCPHCGSEKNP